LLERLPQLLADEQRGRGARSSSLANEADTKLTAATIYRGIQSNFVSNYSYIGWRIERLSSRL
jgi:hypothetical protein